MKYARPSAVAWAALAVLIVLVGLFAVSVQAGQAKIRFGLSKGYQPPPFAAKDLSGHEQSVEAYKGQVVVLHFWASWCPYCRGEITKLMQIYQEKQAQIIAVSTDENVDTLKQFVAAKKLPYPVIPDGQNEFEITEQYALSGIPVTYVINRDGTIFKRLNGAADIVGTVKQALAQAPQA